MVLQRYGNVGKAKVEGLELELDYRVTEYLSFGVNYAYTDTTLEEDIPWRKCL